MAEFVLLHRADGLRQVDAGAAARLHPFRRRAEGATVHQPGPGGRGDHLLPARPGPTGRRGRRRSSTSGHYVVDHLTGGERIDYLVCDETQFYTAEQVDQLARIVDELQIDVFAVGILTDFQTRLFPGSQRLVELCDRIEMLQVRVAVLVRRPGHPQRPDGRRRDGDRGRPGGGRGHRRARRGAGGGRVRGALPARTTGGG